MCDGYIVEQIPQDLFSPDEDRRYFQGWSSWNPNRALWYDQEHAKKMSLADAQEVALTIGLDIAVATKA